MKETPALAMKGDSDILEEVPVIACPFAIRCIAKVAISIITRYGTDYTNGNCWQMPTNTSWLVKSQRPHKKSETIVTNYGGVLVDVLTQIAKDRSAFANHALAQKKNGNDVEEVLHVAQAVDSSISSAPIFNRMAAAALQIGEAARQQTNISSAKSRSPSRRPWMR